MNPARRNPAGLATPRRRAILAAVVKVFNERGYWRTSTEDLLEATDLDAFSFVGHFADKEDCFLVTHNFLLVSGRARVEATIPDGVPWAVRLAAGLGAILALIDEGPEAARFLLGAQCNGPEEISGRTTTEILGLEAFMREGRKASAIPGEIPAIVDSALPGGAAFVIHNHLLCKSGQLAGDLYEETLHYLLLPYLGRSRTAEFVATEAERYKPGSPANETSRNRMAIGGSARLSP